jgi:superfamily II DNA or RNA helicase/HKD family nuclease
MDIDRFRESLECGFVDSSIISDIVYQPEVLVNSKCPPKKVLTSIIRELECCEEFFISVAFVTTSGVAVLINTLELLESRGVKGEILVSQYLNFTQPEALRRLKQFSTIRLKILTSENAHAKGYIFKKNKVYSIIVGSSNLTASALSTNKEWNLKVAALPESKLVQDVFYREFKNDFNQGVEVTENFILDYTQHYESQRLVHENNIAKNIPVYITPNTMQKEALNNINALRSKGKTKALLISATGTGKTFLSAFDTKAFNAKRVLFVVHRLSIAKKSLETFKSIYGNSKSMGVYSGNIREFEKDFIFSTIQTISKDAHIRKFPKDHFDYIIIDESHRSGADSYKRLLDFFTPRFLLGMTATPERTDGDDIYGLFDHNIAYEIRLNRALEEGMLSDFHYYGVTDLTINEKVNDDLREFNFLTSEERVDKIIRTSRFYGTDNGITRGLIFCSRKNEAEELSKQFNLRGLKTVSLSGDSSEEERERAIERLESDDFDVKLDYIFTVDIFNEGVDIPSVNQIIMIRPTDSAIIFVQQLGRGLRKHDRKNYLTVIDFIGNYQNNYLIPIALYGDTSYNKDQIRKLLSNGSQSIPGASTINFEEIAKAQIFKSIDSAKLDKFKELKNDYQLLKFKLGRTPMMMDFLEHGARDPYVFVESSKSYYSFVCRIENNNKLGLDDKMQKILALFSKDITNSKRVEECIILYNLIFGNELDYEILKTIINNTYGYHLLKETYESAIHNLNFKFIRENKNKRLLPVNEIYQTDYVYENDGFLCFSEKFKSFLNVEEFKKYLLDAVSYSITSFNKSFNLEHWNDGFLLYKKYSRKDVFRILNVKENPVAQNVGGYLVDSDKKHCPIFVNYHKEDDISGSTKYEDEFINDQEFSWMSKSNRTLSSKDVQSITGKNGSIRLPLFIKKSNDEGVDFYYMGNVTPENNRVEQSYLLNDAGKKVPVVKIVFKLDKRVDAGIYNYLTMSNKISPGKNSDIAINKGIVATDQDEIDAIYSEIPFYDFFAAAGSFSEMQSSKDYSLIKVDERYNSKNGYFACRVIGESMNKRIPNGSKCLFKKYIGGSRDGKIMLVEHYDLKDLEYDSSFTVKVYTSEKVQNSEEWLHSSIILKPLSYDKSFNNIVLTEEQCNEMRVVGEFIKVLE